MLEPPGGAPVLHHHVTPPPAEMRAAFSRSQVDAQRRARAIEGSKDTQRRREEAEERKQKLADVSKLPISEQIKLLL